MKRALLAPIFVLCALAPAQAQAMLPAGDYDIQVVRDGAAVARDSMNTPVPIDPGPHLCIVRVPGREAATLATRGRGHSSPESPEPLSSPPSARSYPRMALVR